MSEWQREGKLSSPFLVPHSCVFFRWRPPLTTLDILETETLLTGKICYNCYHCGRCLHHDNKNSRVFYIILILDTQKICIGMGFGPQTAFE